VDDGVAERFVEVAVLDSDDERFDVVETAAGFDQCVADLLADGLDVDQHLFGGDDHGAVEQNHGGVEVQRLEKMARFGKAARRRDGERTVRRDTVPDLAGEGADALVRTQKSVIEIGQINGCFHKR